MRLAPALPARRSVAALAAALMAMLWLAAPLCAERAWSPEGQLFPVFDMRLHVVCQGSGRPAVVLEAGLGANHLDWTLLQPLLAPHLKVCSYDRAGAGFSSRTARPRSAAAITEELHELVRQAGIPRPFILIGHSFGGMLSFHYAKRWPEDIASLVLLDAMCADQFERFEAAGVHLETDPHRVLGATPGAAAAYHLPEALQPLAIDLAESDSARVFTVREMAMLGRSAAQVREAGPPHVRARVLVHGNQEWNAAYPDGRMERTWMTLQTEMAAFLGAPPPLVIPHTSHQIALDAPEAVAAVVLELARAQ
jgi:pimeloyl-ACP methyl ester carboxylesterase